MYTPKNQYPEDDSAKRSNVEMFNGRMSWCVPALTGTHQKNISSTVREMVWFGDVACFVFPNP